MVLLNTYKTMLQTTFFQVQFSLEVNSEFEWTIRIVVSTQFDAHLVSSWHHNLFHDVTTAVHTGILNSMYIDSLRTMWKILAIQRVTQTTSSSKRNFVYTKTKCMSVKVKHSREQLERMIEERGIQVDNHLHQDLASIMEDHNIVSQNWFQWIFLDQQESRSMRWEPAMIRLVSNIYPAKWYDCCYLCVRVCMCV